MQKITIASYLIILFICISLTPTVHANGRQPGVAVADVPVKAVCEDTTGMRHDLARAKIALGGATRSSLNARVGAANSDIPLARIREVSLSDSVADREGFAKASVLFHDNSTTPYMLKVREGEKPFELTGYTSQGTILKIPVTKCRRIIFSPLSGTEKSPEAKPVMKK